MLLRRYDNRKIVSKNISTAIMRILREKTLRFTEEYLLRADEFLCASGIIGRANQVIWHLLISDSHIRILRTIDFALDCHSTTRA